MEINGEVGILTPTVSKTSEQMVIKFGVADEVPM